MNFDQHIILGVHITERLTKAQEVQYLFSEYGSNIKTRLGLHEVENANSPNGLVLLEMFGEEARCLELAEKLDAIPGIEVQKMIFNHD
jgi:hypothetical protein